MGFSGIKYSVIFRDVVTIYGIISGDKNNIIATEYGINSSVQNFVN